MFRLVKVSKALGLGYSRIQHLILHPNPETLKRRPIRVQGVWDVEPADRV